MAFNQNSINARRRIDVVLQFQNNIGQRILVMTEPYPFFIVGVLEKVESDFAFIKIEASNITELDDHVIAIHIDIIQAFFIESKEIPIPNISI